MRTTLDIEDALLIRAKTEAAKKGKTLTSIVEEALRRSFSRRSTARAKPYRYDPPVVKGKGLPAVDIADRRALLDFLDKNP